MAPELTADRAVDHTKTTFRSRRQFLQKDEVAGFLRTNLNDGPINALGFEVCVFYKKNRKCFEDVQYQKISLRFN